VASPSSSTVRVMVYGTMMYPGSEGACTETTYKSRAGKVMHYVLLTLAWAVKRVVQQVWIWSSGSWMKLLMA